MRKIFVKFSNSRSRANTIKTEIIRDGDRTFVKKSPMTEESRETLRNMYEGSRRLAEAYPDCEICSCAFQGDDLIFDYIDGPSLGNKYWDAYRSNDREMFFRITDLHRGLLFRNENNKDVFASGREFSVLFGDGGSYRGGAALKVTDFEATAFNIIERGDSGAYVMFDYECIYDFPLPVELVEYHCVYRTLYLCMPFLNSFVKSTDFLSHLGLLEKKDRLEESWKLWRDRFSFGEPEEKEKNLAQIKENYTKPIYAVTGWQQLSRLGRWKIELKMRLKRMCPAAVYDFLKRIYNLVKK